MRVIAGTYRSRRLLAPAGESTRPTSDRLRETLFNVLSPWIPGARFADLYAGTGAVGIEAISRGAAYVLFAERAPEPLSVLRGNLRALAIGSGYAISERSTASTLGRLLPSPAQPFDVIFLDPPYDAVSEYQETFGVLGSTPGTSLVGARTVVVAEHATRLALAARYGRLHRTRTLRQGDASLSFFASAPEPKAGSTEPDASGEVEIAV